MNLKLFTVCIMVYNFKDLYVYSALPKYNNHINKRYLKRFVMKNQADPSNLQHSYNPSSKISQNFVQREKFSSENEQMNHNVYKHEVPFLPDERSSKTNAASKQDNNHRLSTRDKVWTSVPVDKDGKGGIVLFFQRSIDDGKDSNYLFQPSKVDSGSVATNAGKEKQKPVFIVSTAVPTSMPIFEQTVMPLQVVPIAANNQNSWIFSNGDNLISSTTEQQNMRREKTTKVTNAKSSNILSPQVKDMDAGSHINKTIKIKTVKKKMELLEEDIFKVSDDNDSVVIDASNMNNADNADVFSMIAPLLKIDQALGTEISWDIKKEKDNSEFIEISNEGLSPKKEVPKANYEEQSSKGSFGRFFSSRFFYIAIVVAVFLLCVFLLLTCCYELGDMSANYKGFGDLKSKISKKLRSAYETIAEKVNMKPKYSKVEEDLESETSDLSDDETDTSEHSFSDAFKNFVAKARKPLDFILPSKKVTDSDDVSTSSFETKERKRSQYIPDENLKEFDQIIPDERYRTNAASLREELLKLENESDRRQLEDSKRAEEGKIDSSGAAKPKETEMQKSGPKYNELKIPVPSTETKYGETVSSKLPETDESMGPHSKGLSTADSSQMSLAPSETKQSDKNDVDSDRISTSKTDSTKSISEKSDKPVTGSQMSSKSDDDDELVRPSESAESVGCFAKVLPCLSPKRNRSSAESRHSKESLKKSEDKPSSSRAIEPRHSKESLKKSEVKPSSSKALQILQTSRSGSAYSLKKLVSSTSLARKRSPKKWIKPDQSNLDNDVDSIISESSLSSGERPVQREYLVKRLLTSGKKEADDLDMNLVSEEGSKEEF